MVATRRGGHIPRFPSTIPADWTPSLQLVNRSPVLAAMSDDELNTAVAEFVAFATRHKIVRATFSHTFFHWLEKRSDSTWVPKRWRDA